jgi:hypothetical protein
VPEYGKVICLRRLSLCTTSESKEWGELRSYRSQGGSTRKDCAVSWCLGANGWTCSCSVFSVHPFKVGHSCFNNEILNRRTLCSECTYHCYNYPQRNISLHASTEYALCYLQAQNFPANRKEVTFLHTSRPVNAFNGRSRLLVLALKQSEAKGSASLYHLVEDCCQQMATVTTYRRLEERTDCLVTYICDRVKVTCRSI